MHNLFVLELEQLQVGDMVPQTIRPETMCPKTMCPGDNVPQRQCAPETIWPRDNVPRRQYALRQSAPETIWPGDYPPWRQPAPETICPRRQHATDTIRPGDNMPRDNMPTDNMPRDNMPQRLHAQGGNVPRGTTCGPSVSQSVPTILSPFVPLNKVGFKVHYHYLTMLG